MLKKLPFSLAQPRRAETHLYTCSVLASFRPSTYRLRFSDVENTGGGFPFAKAHFTGERPHRVRSVPPRPSLAAALLGRHFEQPDGMGSFYSNTADFRPPAIRVNFPTILCGACLG